MAGGLAVIGVMAALVVSHKEHEEEVAEQQAEETDNGGMMSDATAQAMLQRGAGGISPMAGTQPR